MTLDSVNERAQAKFAQVRAKLKLDVENQLTKVTEEFKKENRLNEEKFQSLVKDPEVVEVIESKVNDVDNTFNFIDSLKLPPNLSLAIGLIISGYKTNNKEDFAKAVGALGDHVNE